MVASLRELHRELARRLDGGFHHLLMVASLRAAGKTELAAALAGFHHLLMVASLRGDPRRPRQCAQLLFPPSSDGGFIAGVFAMA